MVSNKVTLGLFLSFSLAMGYQTIKQSNQDGMIKKPLFGKYIDQQTTVIEKQSEKDLDELIDETIKANSKLSDTEFKELKDNDKLNHEDWIPVTNESNKTLKIQKMQKIAIYISTKYDISINNAEKIVYATFDESMKKNLEPMLVLSLIENESGFKQHIKSPVGAVGLTQVMPQYHKEKIAQLRKTDGTDLFSIHGNIKVGTQILREYLNQAGGNVQRALQMYNGSVGDSTQRYSNQILSRMKMYASI